MRPFLRTVLSLHLFGASLLLLRINNTGDPDESPRIEEPPADRQVSMADFCANLPDPGNGEPALIDGTLKVEDISEPSKVLWGTWDLPGAARMTVRGDAALVEVGTTPFTFVSCGGRLVFDTTEGDSTVYRLGRDVGYRVDPAVDKLVYFWLERMNGNFWIVADDQEPSTGFTVNVLGSTSEGTVCGSSPETSWGWDQAALAPPQDELSVVNCGRVRCWAK